MADNREIGRELCVIQLSSNTHLPSEIRYQKPDNPKLFHAFEIVAGARVHANRFAFVDEQRHRDDGAALDSCRFGAALRRIALQTRIGLSNLIFHSLRRLDAQNVLFPFGQLDGRIVFEKLGDVADLSGAELHRFVAFHVHEMEIFAIAVKKLDVGALDKRRIHAVARAPGLVESRAGLQVFQFGAHKGAALAGLDVLKIHDLKHFALVFDGETVLEIGS